MGLPLTSAANGTSLAAAAVAVGADERFEAWPRVPLPPQPPQPHLEVRRAHPSEFEKIYELVDEAFGTSRSHAL